VSETSAKAAATRLDRRVFATSRLAEFRADRRRDGDVFEYLKQTGETRAVNPSRRWDEAVQAVVDDSNTEGEP